MSIPLGLGAIAPSWMNMASSDKLTEQLVYRTLNNTTLREGYIIGRHYPQDEGYTAYKSVVYDVLVAQMDGQGGLTWDTINSIEYQGTLGSSSDQESMTLRSPVKWKGTKPDERLLAESTRVLVAFIDGRSNQGLIVGCLPHPNATPDTKDKGHNAFTSFNGVETVINKDGELSFTFTGQIIKPDNTVTKADEVKEITGTTIKLTKEGNILLDDVKGESILIDKANKTITVTARAKTDNITEKDWTVSVKGNINIKAEGNASFDAGKKTFLGSTKATQNVVLGKELHSALSMIVGALENFMSTPAIPGQPVLAGPTVQAILKQYKVKYGTVASCAFLSKKKFTE